MGKTGNIGVLGAWLMLSACDGTIGGSGPTDAPPPPDVVPAWVPSAPEVVPTDGQCFALEAGERLASVSPEGHAWLLRETASGTRIRVIDPFEPAAETVTETSLSSIDGIEAWSAGDAALVAGGLWRLESFARVELSVPSGFALPATLCGDPSRNGFVVASGQVFEHRNDGHWWGWNPGVAPQSAPKTLLTFDGECVGLDNFLWATAEDGTLWRIDGSEAMAPVRFAGLKSAAVTDALLAVLDGGRLWMGPPPWSAWEFPGEAPSALSAADGGIWMMSGAQLLRFDGTRWTEVLHDLAEPALAFEAHAGGIWLAGSSQICHQAIGPMLRVEGIRPYQRSGESSFEFRLRANASEMNVTAELDGEPLNLGPDAEEGWLLARGSLASVGWHRFELAAEGPGGLGTRAIEVKRLPEIERSWAGDIEPIYLTSCTGESCHGGAQAPALDSYELWKSYATKIRTRVVEAKTMPPASSQGPEWGDEQVAIIAQWLEGGMLP